VPALRAFVAIPLPEEVRDAIGAFARGLRPFFGGARWERADKLHLTLKFLGDTDDRLVGEILTLLGDCTSRTPPFPMTVSGFGGFPSLHRPRVLWVGCADAGGTLLRLHDDLEGGLAALGFAREERAFHPHITIARIRDEGVGTHLTSLPKNLTFDPRHTLVTELFLMKSVLQPGGSEYTVVGSSRLT
jgi:2'-5' RNA ligase